MDYASNTLCRTTAILATGPHKQRRYQRFNAVMLPISHITIHQHDSPDNRPHRGSAKPLPRLRKLLSGSPLDVHWSPFSDILFWVLCLGLCLADSTGHEAWFVDKVTETAGFLRLRGWSEAETLLLDFFYLEYYHGPSLQMPWEKVEQRRVSDPESQSIQQIGSRQGGGNQLGLCKVTGTSAPHVLVAHPESGRTNTGPS